MSALFGLALLDVAYRYGGPRTHIRRRLGMLPVCALRVGECARDTEPVATAPNVRPTTTTEEIER